MGEHVYLTVEATDPRTPGADITASSWSAAEAVCPEGWVVVGELLESRLVCQECGRGHRENEVAVYCTCGTWALRDGEGWLVFVMDDLEVSSER